MGCCNCSETALFQGEELCLSEDPQPPVDQAKALPFSQSLSFWLSVSGDCNLKVAQDSLQMVWSTLDDQQTSLAQLLLSSDGFQVKLNNLIDLYSYTPDMIHPKDLLKGLQDLLHVGLHILPQLNSSEAIPNTQSELTQIFSTEFTEFLGVVPRSREDLLVAFEMYPQFQQTFSLSGLEEWSKQAKILKETCHTFKKDPERESTEEQENSDKAETPVKPLVIAINLGPSKTDEFIVYPGEDKLQAAKVFAAKHRFTAKERRQFLKFVVEQSEPNQPFA